MRIRTLKPLGLPLSIILAAACGPVAEHGEDPPAQSDRPATVAKRLELDWSVGSAWGADEVSFAEPSEVAVSAAGDVVIFDIMANRVSRFDRDGRFLNWIGGSGQGPGEYSGLLGLTVGGGRVYAATTANRIMVFELDGSHLEDWPVNRRVSASQPLSMDSAGNLQVALVLHPGGLYGEPPEIGRITLDRSGALVDSAGSVRTPWDDETRPGTTAIGYSKSVRWLPSGNAVAAVGSRSDIAIVRPEGLLTIPSDYPRARLREDEAREWEQYNVFLRTRSGRPRSFPPPPEHKPSFRQLVASSSGEIWVVRSTPSSRRDPTHPTTMAGFPAWPGWLEPFVAKVFSEEGDRVALVEGPDNLRIGYARGDTIWGFLKDDMGAPLVVRMVAR